MAASPTMQHGAARADGGRQHGQYTGGLHELYSANGTILAGRLDLVAARRENRSPGHRILHQATHATKLIPPRISLKVQSSRAVLALTRSRDYKNNTTARSIATPYPPIQRRGIGESRLTPLSTQAVRVTIRND